MQSLSPKRRLEPEAGVETGSGRTVTWGCPSRSATRIAETRYNDRQADKRERDDQCTEAEVISQS